MQATYRAPGSRACIAWRLLLLACLLAAASVPAMGRIDPGTTTRLDAARLRGLKYDNHEHHQASTTVAAIDDIYRSLLELHLQAQEIISGAGHADAASLPGMSMPAAVPGDRRLMASGDSIQSIPVYCGLYGRYGGYGGAYGDSTPGYGGYSGAAVYGAYGCQQDSSGSAASEGPAFRRRLHAMHGLDWMEDTVPEWLGFSKAAKSGSSSPVVSGNGVLGRRRRVLPWQGK